MWSIPSVPLFFTGDQPPGMVPQQEFRPFSEELAKATRPQQPELAVRADSNPHVDDIVRFVTALRQIREVESRNGSRAFFSDNKDKLVDKLLREFDALAEFVALQPGDESPVVPADKLQPASGSLAFFRKHMRTIPVHTYAFPINDYHWNAAKWVREIVDVNKDVRATLEPIVDTVLTLPDYHLEEFMQLVTSHVAAIEDKAAFMKAAPTRTKQRHNLLNAMWYMDTVAATANRAGVQTVRVANENVFPYVYVSLVEHGAPDADARTVEHAAGHAPPVAPKRSDTYRVRHRMLRLDAGSSAVVDAATDANIWVAVHMPFGDEMDAAAAAENAAFVAAASSRVDSLDPAAWFVVSPVAQYGQMLSTTKDVPFANVPPAPQSGSQDASLYMYATEFEAFSTNLFGKYIQRSVESGTCGHYIGIFRRFDPELGTPQFTEERRRSLACPDMLRRLPKAAKPKRARETAFSEFYVEPADVREARSSKPIYVCNENFDAGIRVQNIHDVTENLQLFQCARVPEPRVLMKDAHDLNIADGKTIQYVGVQSTKYSSFVGAEMRQLIADTGYLPDAPITSSEEAVFWNDRIASVAEVKPSTIPGAGRGVFAKRPIRKWEVIGKYGGQYFMNRADAGKDYVLMFRRGFVDAEDRYPFSNLMGLINDARSADGNNVAFFELFCVAVRDIAQGEELFVSYSEESYWNAATDTEAETEEEEEDVVPPVDPSVTERYNQLMRKQEELVRNAFKRTYEASLRTKKTPAVVDLTGDSDVEIVE